MRCSHRLLLGAQGTKSSSDVQQQSLAEGTEDKAPVGYNGRALLGVQGTSPDKVQWQSLAGSAEDKAPAAYSGNSPVKGMGDMAGWEHRD